MLKKTISYEDFNGVKRTEDFYFHLTKADVTKWVTMDGDYTLDKVIERMMNENNGKELIELFEDLIYRSYGKKSLDGKVFDRSKEVRDEFVNSAAYSELFMEIVSDANKAAEFINGILPKEMIDEVRKAIEENPDGVPDGIKEYLPGLTK